MPVDKISSDKTIYFTYNYVTFMALQLLYIMIFSSLPKYKLQLCGTVEIILNRNRLPIGNKSPGRNKLIYEMGRGPRNKPYFGHYNKDSLYLGLHTSFL